MKMNAVKSSNIGAIGYDAGSGKLRVSFNDGALYEYSDVPQGTYDSLMAAPSVGSYFHRNVRTVYSYSKL